MKIPGTEKFLFQKKIDNNQNDYEIKDSKGKDDHKTTMRHA